MPNTSENSDTVPVKPLLGACLVLAGGLALSLLLRQYAGQQVRLENETQLDLTATVVESGLKQRLNQYETLLHGLQGLYVASQTVNRREFHRYADNLPLQDYGGIRAIHFTRRVAAEDKAAFVAAVRKDRSVDPRGLPDFAIHPDGERAEYFVIEYIEPFADNRRALGLDAGSQEANRATLLAARDSGKILLTPPFPIVQADAGKLGLVMRKPVYRNDAPLNTVEERRAALLGFVGLTLEADRLLGGIADAPPLADLRVSLRDVGAAGSPADEAAPPLAAGGAGIAPALSRTRSLEAAGRQWQIEVAAGEDWLAARPGRSRPQDFLAAGGAISLLLALLYFVLARGRDTALQLARNMTRELRESEARFRDLTELSADWYWEQDAQFRFTQMSIGVFNKSGFSAATALGRTRWELPIEGIDEEGWAVHRARLERHEPFHGFTYRMRTPDGGLRWFSISGRPIFDAEGRFRGYRGTGHDITEQVQAETRLRAQADLLQAVFDHVNQGISVVDRDLRLVACNRRFLDLLGFPAEYGAGGTPFETFVRYNAERGEYGPGDIEALVRARVVLARRFEPHRFKRTRPDGTVLEVIGTPLPGGGMVTTYTDVTEQEHIAAEFRRERDFSRRLIESIPGIFYLFDAEGHYLLWNRNFETVTGYSAEELRARHPLDFFEGEDRELIARRIDAVFDTGSATAEATMVMKDGSRRPHLFTGERITLEDGRPAVLGVGLDMSERKRIEEQLARQGAVLQATLEAMDQGISVVDAELNMSALNRRFCELLEFPEEMARKGASFADFARFNAERGEYGPCDVEAKVAEMVERARHPRPHVFRRRRPNGRIIEVRGNPLPGGGFVTTYTDVTEQEQAQAALRLSEQRNRKLIELSPDAIFVHRGHRVLLTNPAAVRLWGLDSVEEAIGRNVLDFIHADSLELVRQRIAKLESDPGLFRLPWAEQNYRRVDGTVVPVEGSATRIELEDGPAILSVIRDISERKAADDAIRELNATLEQRVRERTAELEASNQELESFSYSVSHDLRAPLRAINGFSHLLEEEYSHRIDANGLNYLARIRAASQKMGELIDNLLDLARVTRQELKRQPVDLSRLAQEVLDGLREQEPQRRVLWRCAAGLSAEADPVLLRVLLENLLGNAWKFTARQEEARIEFGVQQPGETPVFFVRDNGAGFDPAYADKLFKPFQRLHRPDEFAGTGIGLATVHRIVRRHGGRVWAEGRPGLGASFFFTLP